MIDRYPCSDAVLTLGKNGATFQSNGKRVEVKGKTVEAVDTTAAGDTFIGYFVAGLGEGRDPAECLERANRAASICVQRRGGAVSIPSSEEV